MVVILMGVTGVGKTTVGQALAADLHWRFADADDYHSMANIAKMPAGQPLTDEDRAPWLAALHRAISGWLASSENVVLACSALKDAYRKQLLIGPEVKLVYLIGSYDLIAVRVAARRGHYMNPSLLRSQFDTLEPPLDAVTVDAGLPVAQIVSAVRAQVGI